MTPEEEVVWQDGYRTAIGRAVETVRGLAPPQSDTPVTVEFLPDTSTAAADAEVSAHTSYTPTPTSELDALIAEYTGRHERWTFRDLKSWCNEVIAAITRAKEAS